MPRPRRISGKKIRWPQKVKKQLNYAEFSGMYPSRVSRHDGTHVVKEKPVKRNAGRKVKGGKAVSLKNFTGRVIRKSNGQVLIEGRGKRA